MPKREKHPLMILARKASKPLRYTFSPHLVEYYELGATTKNWVLPRNLPARDSDGFVPEAILGEAGLRLEVEAQLRRLRTWGEQCSGVFDELRKDQRINTLCLGKGYIHNGYYPTPDAEIYAAMILDFKPARIIEVGSGFSTLIAKKAIDLASLNTVIDVIDPCPRTEVQDVARNVTLKYVEDVALSELSIGPETLLFIDSSHVCRAAGDIPVLFCQLIPSLPSGVVIHVHDIFTPYDYPVAYKRRLYTEQYVLQAMLSHSDRYEVLFATHYLARKHAAEMQAVFGEVVGREEEYFGASFWFRVI